MNTNYLKVLALAGLLFASCKSDDDDNNTVTPVVGEITGDFTSSKTFVKGTYTLKGIVKINSGVTITFDAGSTVTADATDGVDAIVTLNGGKLIVNGTAGEPVVFTEKSKTAGSWGGIIIYGDASIIGASAATSKVSEDGLNQSYGGSNVAHNGGSLKYVRVEYAGKKISDGTSEMNSFSFYAVGTGTILENLVAYKGADDGFEFYGGTVSAKNLVAYGNFDDSFDWQDSWKGQSNTNWYAYQVGTGNYGMEIEASNNNNAFYPKFTNVTLRRAAGTQTEGGSSAAEYDAIQFKKHGNGEFSNLVISGYKQESKAVAVRIQDAGTNTEQVNGSKIKILNAKIEDGLTPYKGAKDEIMVSFPAGTWSNSATATGASLTKGAWSIVDGVDLLKDL